MPAVVPFIPLIVGAIGLGETIYSAVNQPSAPQQPQPSALDPNAAQEKAQQDLLKREAMLHAAPSVQERLGGSVAPDFFASEVARVSGNPGDQALAAQVLNLPQLQGLGQTSTTGVTSPSSGFGTSGGGAPFGLGEGNTNKEPNIFEQLLSGQGLSGFSGGGGVDQGLSGGYQ